jgi:hypothetical protein
LDADHPRFPAEYVDVNLPDPSPLPPSPKPVAVALAPRAENTDREDEGSPSDQIYTLQPPTHPDMWCPILDNYLLDQRNIYKTWKLKIAPLIGITGPIDVVAMNNIEKMTHISSCVKAIGIALRRYKFENICVANVANLMTQCNHNNVDSIVDRIEGELKILK